MRHSAFNSRRTYCPTCPWSGDRVRREEGPPYGCCPQCQTPVRLATTLADRQAAKAKRELAQLQERR
jgi:hypothetical protein